MRRERQNQERVASDAANIQFHSIAHWKVDMLIQNQTAAAQLDATLQRFLQQLAALGDALDGAIARLTDLANPASNPTSIAGTASVVPTSSEDSLLQEIRDGVQQIAGEGVRISNLSDLQDSARFG